MNQLDLICIGMLCADVIAYPVDALPPKGVLKQIERVSLHTGGGANNTGTALARLGARTGLMVRIGGDSFGDFMLAQLQKEGIDTRGVIRAEQPTSATAVLVGADGERTFLHCVGANAAFCEEDVDYRLIEQSGARLVHIAYAFLMPGLDGQPMANVLKKVREMDKITALDTAWDASGKWLETLEPCLPHLDYFLPSIAEAERISGERDVRRMADFFLNKGAQNVVIKMGADGCYFKGGKEEAFLGAFNIDLVDTNGAGDSFVGGFLYGILQGWDLYHSALLGTGTAAHCCMGVGTTSALPSYETVREFIKARCGVSL